MFADLMAWTYNLVRGKGKRAITGAEVLGVDRRLDIDDMGAKGFREEMNRLQRLQDEKKHA